MEENNSLLVDENGEVNEAVEAVEEAAAAAEDVVIPAEVGTAEELDNSGLLKKKHKGVSLDSRKARSGYIFVLPFIIGVILIYLPILLDSIWFSLGDLKSVVIDGMPTTVLDFKGFENYAKALTDSSGFVTSLIEGLQQLLLQVPAVIVFALFIAVVLNQKMLGRAVFRAIFFVPVIIATGLMESINSTDVMTDSAQNGIDDGSGSNAASGIISVLDIEALFAGMKVGGELVAYVVGLVNSIYDIINYSGVQMLIFLAGLQSISPSIYEACQIEGATGWETFWKITFPMISPMILVNAVYTTIDAFTRDDNPTMKFISEVTETMPEQATAMYWMYFIAVVIVIGIVAAIASTFIFYQRRD